MFLSYVIISRHAAISAAINHARMQMKPFARNSPFTPQQKQIAPVSLWNAPMPNNSSPLTVYIYTCAPQSKGNKNALAQPLAHISDPHRFPTPAANRSLDERNLICFWPAAETKQHWPKLGFKSNDIWSSLLLKLSSVGWICSFWSTALKG
jgi:hypothetical protein